MSPSFGFRMLCHLSGDLWPTFYLKHWCDSEGGRRSPSSSLAFHWDYLLFLSVNKPKSFTFLSVPETFFSLKDTCRQNIMLTFVPFLQLLYSLEWVGTLYRQLKFCRGQDSVKSDVGKYYLYLLTLPFKQFFSLCTQRERNLPNMKS